MIYLDGFSGYGGFHHGLEKAGWKFSEVFFSEVDKHAIANYSYNFPNSTYAGSITTVREFLRKRGIPKLDLFTFGWPCQDNSIAGKRKGQTGGTRSSLLYTAAEIIAEFKPRVFIAENVPGLLSVNKGTDILESLKLLSDLSDSCPQYDIEMQLLNTRWFRPQNRERLFFVGHLRGTGTRKIFPFTENDKIYDKGSLYLSGKISTKNNCAACLTGSMGKMSKTDNYIFQVNPSKEVATSPLIYTRPRGYFKGSLNGYAPTINAQSTSTNSYVVSVSNKPIQLNPSKESGGKQPYQQNRVYDPKGVSPALNAQLSDMYKVQVQGKYDDGSEFSKDLMVSGKLKHADIRRLSPVECERLQGLPDNWTSNGNYNGMVKPISDTQRYKLCGNGVTIDVVEFIGKRLKEFNPDFFCPTM